MLYRIEEAPEASGWILMREGEGPQTVATFQPDEERTARVAAVLLNAREAGAPAPKTPTPYGWDSTKTPAPRATGGAWAGNDRPQPGRVYSLSGLAGGGVAEDVTDEAGAPAPGGGTARLVTDEETGRTFEVRSGWAQPRDAEQLADDDRPIEYVAAGATVTVWPSGWAYVRFAAKPAPHVLESLRASGARWLGGRKGWRLQADDLPAPFGARPEVLR